MFMKSAIPIRNDPGLHKDKLRAPNVLGKIKF